MYNNYLKLETKQIPQAASIIAKEFTTSPILTYLIPDEEIRAKILPSIFEHVLTLYQEIGTTYVSSEKIEYTFSILRKTDSLPYFSLIEILIKSIPDTIATLLDIDVIDVGKKILGMKYTFEDIQTYLSSKPFIFLSSLGFQDEFQRKNNMKNIVTSVINEVNITKKSCIVETETKENVNLYMENGFILEKSYTISNPNTLIYLLAYYPD